MKQSPLERLIEDCLIGEGEENCGPNVSRKNWPNASRERRVFAQRKAKYIATLLEERFIITERAP